MKRFTEAMKWSNPWFRRLSARQKCLWQYLCDSCDAAGVIDLDLELAAFHIGEPIYNGDVSAMGERLRKLPCGRIQIIGFLKFQYGQVSVTCPAHKTVFRALEKHGLDAEGNTLVTRVVAPVQETEKEEGDARGRSQSKPRFHPPTQAECEVEAIRLGSVGPVGQAFFDHHTACAWIMKNGKKMADWNAAIRYWVSNETKWAAARSNGHNKPQPQRTSKFSWPENSQQ